MNAKKIAIVLMIALSLSSFAAPAFADDHEGNQMGEKFVRGLANAATGWIEIPKQIWQENTASGPAKGWTWGFVKGIGYAVARSVVGGYEIVTFPIPVPENFRPIMQPEYVLSDLPESPQPR